MSTTRAEPGAFLPDDRIPDTLRPMVQSLFKDLIPYLGRCAETVSRLSPQSASDPRYPRMGPLVDVPYGDGTLRRIVVTYTAWMVQRLLDQLRQLPEQDGARVRDWLRANAGEHLLTLQFPRVRRVGLHIAPEVGRSGAVAR